MKRVAPALKAAVVRKMEEGAVPRDRWAKYLQWLRFYLDFCFRYRNTAGDRDSLAPYHMYESEMSVALRKAGAKAGIAKRVSAHTFRHSFASHLLRANYDIRRIQQRLDHSDLRTTMIYTHTVQSRTLKELASPLDLDPARLRFSGSDEAPGCAAAGPAPAQGHRPGGDGADLWRPRANRVPERWAGGKRIPAVRRNLEAERSWCSRRATSAAVL